MTPGEIAPKRQNSTKNGVNKHSRPGERNDHQALTHQTTLSPGRETNGKPAPGPRAIPRNLPQAWLHALAERPEPETSTPGTSKRPRVAQEGKRIEANRHQGKTSRRTHGPARLNHPNPPPPERRQATLKKIARGNHPEGRTSAESRPKTMERQRLQRKREGKNGRQAPKLPQQPPIREAGSQAETEEEERPKANSHPAH